MIKRRESRETAFALLYEWSLRPGKSIEELTELAEEARGLLPDTYFKTITTTVEENAEEIDERIQKYSTRWKINRISKVSLAALRLSMGEILYLGDIPQGASINEAVEIVKKYGTEDESSYLNGVLGGFVRAEFPEDE